MDCQTIEFGSSAPQALQLPAAVAAAAVPGAAYGKKRRVEKPSYGAGSQGERWCKGHGSYHALEEFGGKDAMCRVAKAAYESAMTQAKNQGETK